MFQVTRSIRTKNLPWAAEDDSLWRRPRSPDSRSPWWWSPPQWAGWPPTGREGMMIGWQSSPGSPRARPPPPGCHILPAAEATHRGRHAVRSLITRSKSMQTQTQGNMEVQEDVWRLSVASSLWGRKWEEAKNKLIEPVKLSFITFRKRKWLKDNMMYCVSDYFLPARWNLIPLRGAKLAVHTYFQSLWLYSL